ncbi:hypothetical protein D910_07515 [Dendroctonus ponderosae]|uniref:Uncharacterized protein n=1 Tax=Dendroctonus ponderosae TaxID=77166 RepID=U4UHS4_DENPD|nr:hypothetical protein D910_07515 [Dendroctonus ponderosae]
MYSYSFTESLQRTSWGFNPEDTLDTYELTTVTYGTASSSFLAIRCLFQLATDSEKNHPDIAQIIKSDFYVDD